MSRQRTTSRSAATLLVTAAYLALTAVAVGCGGSDGGGTTTTAPVAKFTPDTPTPAAGTIALLAGGSSGASVNVRVTATDVPSFFGAAFRIKYDVTALLFNGKTDSGSFLRDGVTDDKVFFAADATTVPGEVLITATRLNPDPLVAPPIDVVGTRDLITVNFIARKAIAVAAVEGRVDFIDPKQICDGSVVPPGCGAIAVTWSGGGMSAK